LDLFSVIDLSKHLRLSHTVGEEIFHRLRALQLCEVTGLSHNVPDLAITSRGRARALELLSLSQYASAAPVSLESYVKQVREQSIRNVEVHRTQVERAFRHLVLDSQMIDRFGTALNSGTSIFLYGPTGVGKTVIAETLSRVLAEDKVWIPYAVEVDGQIITVYDPVVHKAAEEPAALDRDGRWVLCHRPAVLVGGELTGDMLNLQFNPITKFYTGPIQMKANNGALIIDDFGRQRLRPEELLNRWIVPLDRGNRFSDPGRRKNYRDSI
jgi:predicted ATPase with chaperone activity